MTGVQFLSALTCAGVFSAIWRLTSKCYWTGGRTGSDGPTCRRSATLSQPPSSQGRGGNRLANLQLLPVSNSPVATCTASTRLGLTSNPGGNLIFPTGGIEGRNCLVLRLVKQRSVDSLSSFSASKILLASRQANQPAVASASSPVAGGALHGLLYHEMVAKGTFAPLLWLPC